MEQKKKGMDLVTLGVYFLIVILLCVIILPPVLRVFVGKPVEEVPVPETKVSTLSCRKVDDEEAYNLDKRITTHYMNDKTASVVFNYQIVEKTTSSDENEDTGNEGTGNGGALEEPITIEELENLRSIPGVIYNESETKDQFTLTVTGGSISDSKELLTDYIREQAEQQLFYENNGYSCDVTDN